MPELQEHPNNPFTTTLPWDPDELLYFNGKPLIYVVKRFANKYKLHVIFPGGKCRDCNELISEGNSIVFPKVLRRENPHLRRHKCAEFSKIAQPANPVTRTA